MTIHKGNRQVEQNSLAQFFRLRCVGGLLPAPLIKGAVIAIALLAGSGCGESSVPINALPGEPHNGKQLIHQYGCGTCHVIPGAPQANGRVGPSLAHFARRGYIAGVMANNPDNLVRWILKPQAILPKTAMPDLAVTPSEARDLAAYLYTLE